MLHRMAAHRAGRRTARAPDPRGYAIGRDAVVIGGSVRLGAQVVPVASEVEAAQLGFGLSEQVALMATFP
jgi:hypothetical protein